MRTSLLMAALVLTALGGPIEEWGVFETSVRDQKILKLAAERLFTDLYPRITALAAQHPSSQDSVWIFPVKGASLKDVGKGGFRPGIRRSTPATGYDFYDGNLHGGHPAYDIFIRDTNLDCRDDRTGKAVEIVAPVNLLVLSVSSAWEAGSDLRGGKYLWTYSLSENGFLYFAHLDSVRARPGDFCRAGSVLGTVGRTGKNAVARRSPTHLHLMVLRANGNELVPFDYWKSLAGNR